MKSLEKTLQLLRDRAENTVKKKDPRRRKVLKDVSWRNMLRNWHMDTVVDTLGRQANQRRSGFDASRSDLGWHCMIIDLQQEATNRFASGREQASARIKPDC
jgi:hypothetical protein